MTDGYDMHVGLNGLHIIIFRKNLYEKSGKLIRYAWRVQNFAFAMAAYYGIAHRQSGRVVFEYLKTVVLEFNVGF